MKFGNEDAAMATGNDIPSDLRVQLALSDFLRVISEVWGIEESEVATSKYRDRVAASLNELNNATYRWLNPNLLPHNRKSLE